jgi:hypothetical protein
MWFCLIKTLYFLGIALSDSETSRFSFNRIQNIPNWFLSTDLMYKKMLAYIANYFNYQLTSWWLCRSPYDSTFSVSKCCYVKFGISTFVSKTKNLLNSGLPQWPLRICAIQITFGVWLFFARCRLSAEWLNFRQRSVSARRTHVLIFSFPLVHNFLS